MPAQDLTPTQEKAAAAAEGSAPHAIKEPAAEQPATAPGTHAQEAVAESPLSAPGVDCDAPLQAVLEEKLVMNWWVHAHGNIQPLSAANIDGDGNCLPASLLCGLTGCARDQTLSLALRKALHREMIGPRGGIYRERWMTAMALRDGAVGLKLNESQWNTEWDALVAAAATAGTSLSEVHVLILAHVLRRPIIVFSSKVCPACGW